MFGLIVGIAFAATIGVAIGKAIIRLIKFTMKWLKNKIKEKLAKRNTNKVAVAAIEDMVQSAMETSSNEMTMDELNAMEDLSDMDCTHVMAEVDSNGKVTDVELIDADNVDNNVKNLIDRTGEGMVVISA